MNRKHISENKAGLSGEKGLWTAVLLAAVEDASQAGKLKAAVVADARAYLGGRAGMFPAHLERLDLDPGLWPLEFNNET